MDISSFETGSLSAILSELNLSPPKINNLNKDVEFISINKNNEQQTQDSRFVPIRLKPNEAKKAHECQKVMLKFMKMQYEQSIGTKKEDTMRKMYNDAIVDFKEFEAQYKDELST